MGAGHHSKTGEISCEKIIFENKFIDDLDNIDERLNYFTPVWNDLFARGINPAKMIDIGCGTGVFTSYAKAKVNPEIFGVDGNLHALDIAKKYDFKKLIHVADFNLDKIPLQDADFDFCLCKDLLEHLVVPENVVSEAHRLLKPGGYFLVHVPNHFPVFGRLKFLLQNDIDTYEYFPGSDRWNFPHIRFFTKASLIRLIGMIGFKVEMDLSYNFAALPGMAKLPFGKTLGVALARRNPTEFAGAITLLGKKI